MHKHKYAPTKTCSEKTAVLKTDQNPRELTVKKFIF